MITLEWSGHLSVSENIGNDLNQIRVAELRSIRAFVEKYAHLLTGRVLDFGAGKVGTCANPQPYRDLIPQGCTYLPYDVGDELTPPYDSILCTQVFHMVGPVWCLNKFREVCGAGGHLIMTYPTNWIEVEDTDLWRYTRRGMEYLMDKYGFEILHHEKRAELKINNYPFALGYGVVARIR